MNVLWTTLAALLGGIVVWVLHRFYVTPQAVEKAVAQNVKDDAVEATKLAAVAEVKHEETAKKIESLKVEAERMKADDSVATANALLRDATGRRPR